MIHSPNFFVVLCQDVNNYNFHENPKHGLFIGYIQLGKTIANFVLRILSVIHYLRTAELTFSVNLLTSQTSHEAQSFNELKAFENYYSWLPFEIIDKDFIKVDFDELSEVEKDTYNSFYEAPSLSLYNLMIMTLLIC